MKGYPKADKTEGSEKELKRRSNGLHLDIENGYCKGRSRHEHGAGDEVVQIHNSEDCGYGGSGYYDGGGDVVVQIRHAEDCGDGDHFS